MTLFQIWNLASYIAGRYESGGAIPPSRLNLLLPMVQDEWYQALLNEVIAASASEALLSKVMSTTPLKPFKTYADITMDGGGLGLLPDDYRRYVTAYTTADNDPVVLAQSPAIRKVDIVSDELFVKKQRDVFSRPAVTPFGKITSAGLHVVPYDVLGVRLDYFRTPVAPYFDYCQDALSPSIIIYMPEGSYVSDKPYPEITPGPDPTDPPSIDAPTTTVFNLYLRVGAFGSQLSRANVIKPEMTGTIYFSLTKELQWESQYLYRFVYLVLAKMGINLSEEMVTKYAMEMSK